MANVALENDAFFDAVEDPTQIDSVNIVDDLLLLRKSIDNAIVRAAASYNVDNTSPLELIVTAIEWLQFEKAFRDLLSSSEYSSFLNRIVFPVWSAGDMYEPAPADSSDISTMENVDGRIRFSRTLKYEDFLELNCARFLPSSGLMRTKDSSDNVVIFSNKSNELLDLHAAFASETIVVNGICHFAITIANLLEYLAQTIRKFNPQYTKQIAISLSSTILQLSARIRSARFAASVVSPILHPKLVHLEVDTSLQLPLSIAVGEWLDHSDIRSNSSKKQSAAAPFYGARVSITTPITFLLRSKSLGPASDGSKGDVVGRLNCTVTQQLQFVEVDGELQVIGLDTLDDDSLQKYTDLKLERVSINVAWFPGASDESAATLMQSLDVSMKTILARAPLFRNHYDCLQESVVNKTVPLHEIPIPLAELSDNSSFTYKKSEPTTQTALYSALWAGDMSRHKDSGLSSAMVSKGAAQGIFSTAASALVSGLPSRFSLSLLQSVEEEERIVQELDAKCGDTFFTGKWRAYRDHLLSSDEPTYATPAQTLEYSINAHTSFARSQNPLAPARIPKGSPLSARSAAVHSLHTQLWSWGSNESRVLGIQDEHFLSSAPFAPIPVPVSFRGDLGLWRVVKLVCGWSHALALTDAGNLYSWGSGSDGQLGHGSTADVPHPRLVDFFGIQQPLVVVDVAAGGEVSGSHSVVVARGLTLEESQRVEASDRTRQRTKDQRGSDTELQEAEADEALVTLTQSAKLGRVYVWGTGPGTCNTAGTFVTTPTLVSPGVTDIYDPRHGGIKQVSAGGGCTFALTESGALYSWGKYAHGRLGLGIPPEEKNPSRKVEKNVVEFKKVALLPQRIEKGLLLPEEFLPKHLGDGESIQDPDISSSSRGEHQRDREEETSLQSDILTVSPALCYRSRNKGTLPIRSICSGEKHSLAIDAFGLCWSWGNNSFGQLGQGHEVDVWIPRRLLVVQPASHLASRYQSRPASSSYSWSADRNQSLDEDQASVITAGSFHSIRSATSVPKGFLPSAALVEADNVYELQRSDEASLRAPPSTDASETRSRRSSMASTHSSSSLSSRSSVHSSASTSSSLRTALQHPELTTIVPVRFKSVSCGVSHSMAIDMNGGLWTWGGSGSAVLGHGDYLSNDALIQRSNILRARMESRKGNVLKGYDDDDPDETEEKPTEGLPNEVIQDVIFDDNGFTVDTSETEGHENKRKAINWTKKWLLPRKVCSFSSSSVSVPITQAGGGLSHSWAISEDGQMFTWGLNTKGQLGSALDPSISSPISQHLSGIPRLVGGSFTSATTILDANVTTSEGDEVKPEYSLGSSVNPLSACSVLLAASGAWSTFAITRAEYVAENLLQAIVLPKGVLSEQSRKLLQFQEHTSHVRSQVVYGQDCVLRLDDGIEFPVHRAILACNSPVFATMLREKSIPGRITQLILPGVTYSLAIRLVEWMYTGQMSAPLSPLDPQLSELREIAKEYEISRLWFACDCFLNAPVTHWVRGLRKGVSALESQSENYAESSPLVDMENLSIPKGSREEYVSSSAFLSTFEDSATHNHFKLLTAPEPMYYDLVLSSGSVHFPCHIPIVCANSTYFYSLVDTLLSELVGPNYTTVEKSWQYPTLTGSPIQIALPESPLSLFRLLYFLYMGSLPPMPKSMADMLENGFAPGISVAFFTDNPMGENESTSHPEEWVITNATENIPVDTNWSPFKQYLLDMQMANRYALPRMNAQAQSLIEFSAEETPELLALQSQYPASILRERALNAALLDKSSFVKSINRLPSTIRSHVISEIFDRVQSKDEKWYSVVADEGMRPILTGEKKSTAFERFYALMGNDKRFPWKYALGFFISFLGFMYITDLNTSMSHVVPLINVVCFGAIAFIFMKGYYANN